jgi:hypothetical protein
MTGVDMTVTMQTPCPPAALFTAVQDLADYPEWLSIVARAEPIAPEEAASGGAPAWSVELRGRIGPLARSKRLRMVRTVHEPPERVRFERRELDGRNHSAWVLEARVHPDPVDGHRSSALEMSLHYGGAFGGNLVESLLLDEIEQSRPRLAARVARVEQVDPESTS